MIAKQIESIVNDNIQIDCQTFQSKSSNLETTAKANNFAKQNTDEVKDQQV